MVHVPIIPSPLTEVLQRTKYVQVLDETAFQAPGYL